MADQTNTNNSGSGRTKITLIILSVLLVAVIAVVAGLLITSQMKEKSYTEAVSKAEKSLAANNYEDAIIQYKKAIAAKPEEVDTYIKLAEVYVVQNDTSMAKAILRKGYDVTKSAKISHMLSQIEGQSLVATIENGEKTPEVKVDLAVASKNIGWNTSFIQKIEQYDFDTYKEDFGLTSQITKDSDGFLEVVHSGIDATFYYRNTADNADIVDDSRRTPNAEGMPEKISLNSLNIIFRNYEGGVKLSRMQMLVGEKIRPKTADGRTYIEMPLGDCLMRIETDKDGNIVSYNPWNEILLLNANQKKTKDGYLSGVVLDAVTGAGINGATVSCEATSASAKSESVRTDVSGAFSVELEPGTYNIVISADNYVEETFPFVIEEGKSYSGEQFVLSPELSMGTARIVLEWNAEPQDLDSYLDGQTDGGASVNTSFSHKTASSAGNKLAELDLDDVDGYGPETTTLYDLNGKYTFTVADFRRTGTMAQYGATVKVYLPGKQPQTITLSSMSGVTDIWVVCEIDHGELKVINSAP